MSVRKSVIIAVACGAMLTAPTLFAGGASGRTIGITCNGCHGTDGVSKGAAPSLKGLPAEHIKTSMTMFKSGTRPSTIMGRIAKGYSDEDIAAMSDYFANLK
ncbi:MAG: c-type cytochrome [Pseudomonadota bacterium]